LVVLRRSLTVLLGLTLGDYLLWNWSLHGSLNGERDVLALVSGLTLPPLILACMWMLTMSVARLIARSTSRPRPAMSSGRAVAEPDQEGQGRGSAPAPDPPHGDAPAPAVGSAAQPAVPASEKLAA
jgi:hypothetical protein